MDINIKELMAKKATPTDVNSLIKLALGDDDVWHKIQELMQGRSRNGNAKMDGLEVVNIILAHNNRSDNPMLNEMVDNGHITKNDLFIKLSRVLRSLSIKVKNGRIAGLLTADDVEYADSASVNAEAQEEAVIRVDDSENYSSH